MHPAGAGQDRRWRADLLIIGQVFAILAYLEAEGLLLRSDDDVIRFQAVPDALERLEALAVLDREQPNSLP